ncbi:MAG TPA: methyltransferase domain-containing protein [Solirubrobacteraceae bacterium]|nr:methyltransferase domain-containing protein [Solirubrobacteraceae bacterium]
MLREGYLDLLGEAGDPTGRGPGQRLMVSRALPLIYERLWRPLGGRVLMGALGPSMAGERRIALEMLEIGAGDTVLDVACGPGNFTRAFADEAGPDGLVVGLDASPTMLAQAARERPGDGVEYVRASATDLPFTDASFDAVCCFAALYLIEEPLLAVAEIARVLAPGGRVALLSSVSRGPLPAGVANAVVRPLTGVRIFGRDDLTRELRAQGLTVVRRRVSGFAQFVSAHKGV